MYIPAYFDVKDLDEIVSFLHHNAFGQLVSSVDGRLFASHLPFLTGPQAGSLLTHLARPNPQWKSIEGQEVLITFQGPHDYISPTWYQAPGVPTWNYQAVHIYGCCELITDVDELHNLVSELTAKYEAGRPVPWQPDYDRKMLKGIVGLKVLTTDIQCKYKLNQNRSAADRAGVAEHLQQEGAHDFAAAMQRDPGSANEY